ncbi:MAG: 30S ribosome-binding factor RbfA [Pseudomonadota bacterium]
MTFPVKRGPEPASQRQLKVAENLRHQLAEWLLRGTLHDPELQAASITVSEVRASRDLRNATVYVAVLGNDTAPPTVLDALNRAGPTLGGRLARSLHLKYAPKLRFANDDRYGEAARIDSLLRGSRPLDVDDAG